MIPVLEATYMKRVTYLPLKANGDLTSPFCQRGTIAAIALPPGATTVLVKLDKALEKYGWEKAKAESLPLSELYPL